MHFIANLHLFPAVTGNTLNSADSLAEEKNSRRNYHWFDWHAGLQPRSLFSTSSGIHHSDSGIPGTLTLNPERQSARMSKITNDGLTRSGIGCFIVEPIR